MIVLKRIFFIANTHLRKSSSYFNSSAFTKYMKLSPSGKRCWQVPVREAMQDDASKLHLSGAADERKIDASAPSAAQLCAPLELGRVARNAMNTNSGLKQLAHRCTRLAIAATMLPRANLDGTEPRTKSHLHLKIRSFRKTDVRGKLARRNASEKVTCALSCIHLH